MNDIYYHIGLHKTGTTFLQNEYFPQLPINYFKGSMPFLEVLNGFSDQGRLCVLLSEENFSGRLFSGTKSDDLVDKISSIRNLHSQAKIIVGFRKHKDFVLSAYKQHLHEGGSLSQSEFFNIDDNGIIKNRDLEFGRIIDLVRDNFENVFIYTIDDVRDLSQFHAKLSEFMRLESVSVINGRKNVNKGVSSKFQVKLLRGLNTINKGLIDSVGTNIFYSKFFRALKITPRRVCQHYIPSFGPKYRLNDSLADYLDEKFHEDWNYVLENKSIRANLD